jgi:uncharacterized membrane protein
VPITAENIDIKMLKVLLMDKITYNILRILIVIFLVVGIWFSENLPLAFLFIIVSMTLLYIIPKKVNEVIWDERTQLIKSNASRMAMGIFIFIIFSSGFALLVSNNDYPDYAQAGFSLLNASNLGPTLNWC